MKYFALLLATLTLFSLFSFTPAFSQYSCSTNLRISYLSPSFPRQGETVTLFGTVDYGSSPRIDVYLDGSFLASVWPDSSGSWSYSYYTWMYQGNHRFDVYSQYDGCQPGSATYSFYVTGPTTTYPFYPYGFPGCVGSVAVETPDDVYSGDTAASTITVSNSGNSGGNINFNAFLCKDGGGCTLMDCSTDSLPYDYYYGGYYSGGYYYNYNPNYYSWNYYGSDPSVFLPSQSTASVVCSQNPRSSGTYRIRIDAFGCGLSRSIFSSSFSVRSLPKCSSGFQNSYKCFGNERQQLYQFIDCSSEWRAVETCTYGCSNGNCNPQVSTVTTTVTPSGPTGYFVWLDISSTLLALTFIILIVLLFLVFWKRRYVEMKRAEWFRI